MADRSLPRASTGTLPIPDAAHERTVHLLYQRRSQEMFGFVRRLGLGDEEASDAVQETMLRLWRELASGVAIADPDAWTFRTLYRLGIDSHRLARRLRGLADRIGGGMAGPTDRVDLGGDPARRIEVDAVWQAVDRLPKLPYEQIGVVLEITPGAARGHASTGLATLRRRFDNEDER
jgi:DNA-directed RNA polymerase specialized sigma24 family protein